MNESKVTMLPCPCGDLSGIRPCPTCGNNKAQVSVLLKASAAIQASGKIIEKAGKQVGQAIRTEFNWYLIPFAMFAVMIYPGVRNIEPLIGLVWPWNVVFDYLFSVLGAISGYFAICKYKYIFKYIKER